METIIVEEGVPKCFLCCEIFFESQTASFLFWGQAEEKRLLSDILSKVLSRPINENNVHSNLICEPCANLVKEYEVVEQRYYDLKQQIKDIFSKSTELNKDSCVEYNIDDEDSHFNAFIDHEIDDESIDEICKEPQNIICKTEELNVGITENYDKIINNGKYNVYNEDSLQNVQEPAVEIVSMDGKNDIQRIEQITETNISDVIVHESIDDVKEEIDDNIIIVDVPSLEEEQFEKSDNLQVNNLNKSKGKKRQFKQNKQLMIPQGPVHKIISNEKTICLLCNDESNPIDDENTKNIKQNKIIAQGTNEFDFHTISIHLKMVHSIKICICDICGKDFQRRNEMNDHIDEEHGGIDGGYHCETCNRYFTNLRLLRIHRRLHSKHFSCAYCSKIFSSENLLQEHINIHTGQRPYKCNYCEKDFASKYTLSAHLKIHQDRPRLYSCKHCSKSFYNMQNLSQHEKVHGSVKSFVCSICQKAFMTQHNLEVHQIVHSGYKPYVCGLCGKAFARRAEIKDHNRTHTGEKPFSCDICNMAFAQRSNLTSHKRATHFHDKPHKCSDCGSAFKRKRLLDYHMRSMHTGERPYKCEICLASFVYPEHYKKHLRIHSGEKPYACEVCGKRFNSRDNRNAHRFVHSDKKPYECLVCSMGFMRKPQLYMHMSEAGHTNDMIIVNQPQIQAIDKCDSGENSTSFDEEIILKDIGNSNKDNEDNSSQLNEENLFVDETVATSVVPTQLFASEAQDDDGREEINNENLITADLSNVEQIIRDENVEIVELISTQQISDILNVYSIKEEQV